MTPSENDIGQPTLIDARNAVCQFLEAALPEVGRVDVTRIAALEKGKVAWEAEADVWQPNATLRTLGIRTRRPVLDHQRYLIRLDALLNVLAYELAAPVGKDA
ncbi:MAG: hypothetical protein ACQESR_22870 [Planctomycetota bacterium]